MGNCLVTKLKASVNNPDLPKLGYIVAKMKNTSGDYVDITYKDAIRVFVDGDNGSGHIKNIAGTTARDNNRDNSFQKFSVGEYYVNIEKSPLFKFFSHSAGYMDVDLEQFKYCTNLEELYFGSHSDPNAPLSKPNQREYFWKGDIANLANLTNLKVLKWTCNDIPYESHKVYGNVESLSNLTNLQTLNIGEMKAFTGDIVKAFGKMVKLTDMRIANNACTGDTIDLVAAWRNNGKTTGQLDWNYMFASPGITFGGKKFESEFGVAKLYWEPDWCAVVASAYAKCSKNTPSSKITEWQNAGKSVEVVDKA